MKFKNVIYICQNIRLFISIFKIDKSGKNETKLLHYLL